MKRDLKKQFFHAITNATEDTSYYSEIYLEENLSTFSQRPMTFLMNLLKIRWYYQFPNPKKELHLKDTKRTRWDNLYYRHKSFLVIPMLSKYNYLFTDVLGSLLLPTVSSKTLYKMVEKELDLPGFAKVREEYDRTEMPIDAIYENVSVAFGTTITPKKELELFSRTLLINPFIREILEGIAAQYTPIYAVIDSSYSPEYFKTLLEQLDIPFFSTIFTTGTEKKSVTKVAAQKMQQLERTLTQKEAYGCVFYSADYERLIRPLRKKGHSALFYPKPARFLTRHDLPALSDSYDQVYRTLAGLSLYAGASHSPMYQTMVLYVTPVLYAILEEIHKLSESKKVVFVGSDRNLVLTLYQRFYGKVQVLEWSYILSHPPYNGEDWKRILSQMPSLLHCSAEQLAYTMGGELPDYVIEKRLSQFYTDWEAVDVGTALENRNCLSSYLTNLFSPKEPILLVDLTEGGKSGKDACNLLHSLYPHSSLHYFSWWEMLEKTREIDKETLYSLDRIFRIDSPTLLGIRKDEEELTFQYLQPPFLPKGTEKHMLHIASSYIQKMQHIAASSPYFPIPSKEELCHMLNCGRQNLQQLREEYFL